MLVGSWAEFVYRECGLLKGFEPNIRTTDADFFIRNLRKPIPPANIVAMARERGFLIESDRMNGTTKLADPNGFEVEFLIGKKGAGVEPALKTNMGVTAQALRHLEILSNNSIEVLFYSRRVQVPTPEAYAAHKMVINTQRGIKKPRKMPEL